jgi:nucleoside phosphorylase
MSVNRSEIEIAIICALPLEAEAVKAVMQDTSEDPNDGAKASSDTNAYTIGKIGSHPVVMAHMPGMGKESAASVAATLNQSYLGIKLALLVGLCGGVPNEEERSKRKLGDVIIGNGVVQYDFGREFPDGPMPKKDVQDIFGRQGKEIRSFVAKLQSNTQDLEKQAGGYLSDLLKADQRDPLLQDRLFEANHWHMHHKRSECTSAKVCQQGVTICDIAKVSTCEVLGCGNGDSGLERDNKMKRSTIKPALHFGSIGCGDMVMKSGEHRDRIAKAYNVIGLEMESAGVWDNLPTVIVKSICDYADSHKNKAWQGFAALAAVAYAKAIVGQWPKKVAEQKEVCKSDPMPCIVISNHQNFA